MKLLLDKNYIREVDKVEKENERGVKYFGTTKKGEQIELYDLEANKIAPIVRFLAEGKKNKINWFLWILIGFFLLVFFVVMIYILWPKAENIQTPQTPQITKEVALTPINEKTIKEETKENNSVSLDLVNEVDMMKDLKTSAENEVLKLNYEIEGLNISLNAKIEENKKLTDMVNNLSLELEKLKTRKTENATDEFIYYLGDSVYQSCENSELEEKINKCKTLYYNFLDYGKR